MRVPTNLYIELMSTMNGAIHLPCIIFIAYTGATL